MDQEVQGALSQATAAPQVPVTDAQSAINSLLSKRANYLSAQDPADQAQARQSALEQYQNALKANPLGNYTPTEHTLFTNIANMGKTTPLGALAAGIGAGGALRRGLEESRYDSNVKSAKVGYDEAAAQDKLDLGEISSLKGLLPKTGQSGGWVTKMDKDGNMVSYNPLSGEKRIVHASQGAAYQRAWETLYSRAVQEGMENPEQYAHNGAMAMLGQAPSAVKPGQETPIPAVSGATSQTVPSVTPSGNVGSGGNNSARNIELLTQEIKNTTDPDKLFILKQELADETARTGGVAPVATPSTVDTAARAPTMPTLQYKDKAEEARKKTNSTGMEEAAVKDYTENIAPAAQVADSTLNNLSVLRQIPRTQDAFAGYREKVGSVLGALGMDGKLVTEAENLQQMRPILAKVANDRLLMAKGVQTEGDAQRAYNEFIKITDTQKAVDFMYAWAEELANRTKFKNQVYKQANKDTGSMQQGSDYWNKTDYAKTAPIGILNGKPWTYTSWRDKFLQANPNADTSDAIETWNKLTGRK